MTTAAYYKFDVSWSDMSETVLQVWWDDVIHDLILPLSQEEYAVSTGCTANICGNMSLRQKLL